MSRHLSSSSRRWSVFILLLILAAIYFFSFGPVHALYSSGRLSGAMPGDLVTFYKPIHWVYQNTPLGPSMIRHDAWWERQLKRS